ncbi:hypothetical protein PRECH8_09360 [Insulibacter thermoxylanivorax]|uniref:Uncharacterized protein n=1 Tax=Insulibacter thermoxylanivorax TaxID=2749268 RepID=A0A916VGM6_9BACL|nr:hypothetical protein [Insulibacter thermoxylanivorax]GFR37640.1 hypothetical protein PRECH8_09360 [Insulibacter thermoxylanivorax]
MRRRIWLLLLLLLLFPTAVYAHVVGAFKDFLVDIRDEDATERLRAELEDTRIQIENLTPHVERLNAAFTVKQDEQIPLLQFYQSIGTDVMLNFILDADSIVDVLANLRLIELKLDQDLAALNRLYLEYRTVKAARDALASYEQLLQMIEANLRSREEFLAEYGHLTDEEIADAADSLWAKEANVLDEILIADKDRVQRRIRQITVQDRPRAPFRIEQDLLNRYLELDYYIQSDHVYVHYAKNSLDIILIGMVTRDDERTASLKFEAGFMNGIRIADLYMNQMPGFVLDYSKLNPNSKDFYVDQTNGAIVLMPVEYAGE